MTDTQKLLSCPFCGNNEPELHSRPCTGHWGHEVDYWVDCSNEDCYAHVGLFDNGQSAIENWNKRPSKKHFTKDDIRKFKSDINRDLDMLNGTGIYANNKGNLCCHDGLFAQSLLIKYNVKTLSQLINWVNRKD